MKKIILIIILICMINLASAQIQTLGTFKQGDCVELKQTCANCTFNNITSVLYPNSSQALGNNPMTKLGTEYNYSCSPSADIGQYIVNGVGDVDGLDTVWAYDYMITFDGTSPSTSQGLSNIILFIGLLLILTFTLYGAMVFPWKNNRDDEGYIIGINDLKYVKIILWVFVYLETLFIISILKNISGQFMTGFYSFFNIIYFILLIGLLPFFPLLIFFTIILWLTDKKTQKAIQRGFPVR